jgi:hypothetical protein
LFYRRSKGLPPTVRSHSLVLIVRRQAKRGMETANVCGEKTIDSKKEKKRKKDRKHKKDQSRLKDEPPEADSR